jgi:hypothetical protein
MNVVRRSISQNLLSKGEPSPNNSITAVPEEVEKGNAAVFIALIPVSGLSV